MNYFKCSFRLRPDYKSKRKLPFFWVSVWNLCKNLGHRPISAPGGLLLALTETTCRWSVQTSIDGHVCWNSNRRLPFICLQTKENKLPLSDSLCSKQMEVCCFRLPFSANKQKLLMCVSSVFRLHTYLHICIYVYVYVYIWGHFKRKTENGSPRDFPYFI